MDPFVGRELRRSDATLAALAAAADQAVSAAVAIPRRGELTRAKMTAAATVLAELTDAAALIHDHLARQLVAGRADDPGTPETVQALHTARDELTDAATHSRRAARLLDQHGLR